MHAWTAIFAAQEYNASSPHKMWENVAKS